MNKRYFSIFKLTLILMIAWISIYMSEVLYSQIIDEVEYLSLGSGNYYTVKEQINRYSIGDTLVADYDGQRIIARCILSKEIKKICSKNNYNKVFIGNDVHFVSLNPPNMGVITSGVFISDNEIYTINIEYSYIKEYFHKLFLFEMIFYCLGGVNLILLLYSFRKCFCYLVKN